VLKPGSVAQQGQELMPWLILNTLLDAVDDSTENIPGGAFLVPREFITHLQDDLQDSLFLIVIGDDRNIATIGFR